MEISIIENEGRRWEKTAGSLQKKKSIGVRLQRNIWRFMRK